MLSTKKWIVTILIIVTSIVLAFGQNMDYLSHGTMSAEMGSYLRKNWVQLPNNDYVHVTTNGSLSHVESSSGWDLTINNAGFPCLAEYNGTIYCAVYQAGTTTIGETTYPNPPNNEARVILVKISSNGAVLDSWTTTDSGFELQNIAVKDDSEIALVGCAGLYLEHLSSPNGGGVVLIHNGASWDTSKGFFLETALSGGTPHILSAQYLLNENLRLTGKQGGSNVSFGGIMIQAIGSSSMFCGEISATGVGVSAVRAGGLSSDIDHLQVTNANGDYMITGLYCTGHASTTFYNADGSVGGSIDAHPAGNSGDQMYFAFYNSAGVLQNVEYAYNTGVGTNLKNVDVACSDDAFYTIISNENGGSVVTPTETHTQASAIFMKFDSVGNALWSKQYEGNSAQYGEEILVNGDIVTLCGLEYGTADLDFNAGVVNVTYTSYWAEYFDGIITEPTADFIGTPLSIIEGESVSFADSSGTGTNPITSRSWTFGDSGTSGSTNPTHQYDEPGTYTVELTVSDGDLSDTETKTDYITVENSFPIVQNPIADFNFAEDTTDNSINLNDVFWDVSLDFGEELIFAFAGNENIAVEISENGIVTLTPSENWFGSETITFTATDNNSASVNDEVVITVNPINDAPNIELPASFTFAEESQLTEDFSSYLSDIEQSNGELSLSVSGNSEISAEINNLEVTFSATENWNGSEILTFTVNDNQNRAIASDEIEIFVSFVNDVPTVENPLADFSFDEDTDDNSINLSNVFDDLDLIYADELTFTFSGNENIAVEISENGIVTLTPSENWFGSETITFTATDNNSASVNDEVEITVNPINDAPNIELPASFTFAEESQLTEDFTVYLSDIEQSNGELSLSVSGNSEISAEINNLEVTFSASENWNGSEVLTFTVNDNQSRAIASDDMEIFVSFVNDVPTVENPLADFNFDEDTDDNSINLNNVFGDVDLVYEDELSFAFSGNENIDVEISENGIVTLTPSENWFGSETITFTATDNNSASVNDEVIITVNPINDAPNIELPASFTFAEDAQLSEDFSSYLSDIEQSNGELSLSVSGNSEITAEINNLEVTFSASENWNGSEVLTFTVNDNQNRAIASDEIEIFVSFVNDVPTVENPLADFNFDEDTDDNSINLNNVFGDADLLYGDELIFSFAGNDNIGVEISGNGIVTLSPNTNWFGNETIIFTATDNSAESISDEVEITIESVNDAPEITAFSPEESEIEITEIGEVNFSVTAEDVDSEISYEWFVNSENQDISTNSFVYNFIENGDFEIKCVVSDDEFDVETVWNITANLTGIGDDSLIPSTTQLIGNYPNPFNPSTTIKYDLCETGFVQINIFNIKGQKINSLVNQSENAGKKSIVWNGRDTQNNKIGSGLYFYKLNINGKIHSMEKCMMLK